MTKTTKASEEWEKSLIINLTDDGLSSSIALEYVEFVKEELNSKLQKVKEGILKEAEERYHGVGQGDLFINATKALEIIEKEMTE